MTFKLEITCSQQRVAGAPIGRAGEGEAQKIISQSFLGVKVVPWQAVIND